jgi:hypothetical protein
MSMDVIPRALTIAGFSLLLIGLLLHAGPSIPWLGKLPGDITIERPGFRLQLPIATSLVVSGVLTGVMWLIGKLR